MPLQVAAESSQNPEETWSTDQLIDWALRRFSNRRIAMTTGFGMEGCALIDMLARRRQPVDVVYLDTMFFFPETLTLIERLRRRYPLIRLINRGTTLGIEGQEALHGPRLWERNPHLCCRLRKVDPMRDALRGVDVWITALRRSQSSRRNGLRLVEWNWKYEVLKVSPLAAWSRAEIWDYVSVHQVPYNELHDRGYPSIGCTHCTAPVKGAQPDTYSRTGRWADSEKTECGLHT